MNAVYGSVDESKRVSYLSTMAYAFAGTPEIAERWLGRAGIENVRCLSRGDDVLVALTRVPMGLWVGGRSIPNVGIAGVGASGVARGGGHAKALMIAMLEETREEGTPLSTLYPATIGLYRSAGYELAGGHYQIDARTESMVCVESDATLREGTDADVAEMKALQRTHLRYDGNLDRGPYVWARIFEPRYERAERFVVEESGRMTGYTTFVRHAPEPPYHDLHLADLVVTTTNARNRLLQFFRSHRSFVKNLRWFGGPTNPFTTAWPEKTYEVSTNIEFMVRIVDVDRALSMRGYDEGIAVELAIDVQDDQLRMNSGVRTLSVEGGQATVTSGGRAALTMNVRGLAALYTGYAPARQLRLMGWLDGDDDAIAEAERIFVPRSPWMDHLF